MTLQRRARGRRLPESETRSDQRPARKAPTEATGRGRCHGGNPLDPTWHTHDASPCRGRRRYRVLYLICTLPRNPPCSDTTGSPSSLVSNNVAVLVLRTTPVLRCSTRGTWGTYGSHTFPGSPSLVRVQPIIDKHLRPRSASRANGGSSWDAVARRGTPWHAPAIHSDQDQGGSGHRRASHSDHQRPSATAMSTDAHRPIHAAPRPA